MSTPVRVAAAHVLERVLERGETLDEALEAQASRVAERDRPLLQALTYGALRWLTYLEEQLLALTPRAEWRDDPLLRGLLLAGAWEAQGLSTPSYAAVSEAVEAARRLRRARAQGMVNAVLRRLRREPPAPPADAARRYALPEWLLDLLQERWPEEWRAIAEASNAHPPMTLRIAHDRKDPSEARAILGSRGMPAVEGAVSPSAAILERPVAVQELPGVAEGWLSVQDEAAQLAVPLLDPQAGERVLDACAAPGGKTLQLKEYQPQAEVIALDRSARRLARVQGNVARGGFTATCLGADAGDLAAWWDGTPFQRVLLDAPCTGTGVIRRHPDIKWLRDPGAGARMARIQGQLLRALWRVLAPGGRLLYATCSLLPEENDTVVKDFLHERPEARLGAAPPVGHATGAGYQVLPGEHGMDGFFYACLERPSHS